ncbi:MAG: hypothetical protein J7518_19030 [Nocardioidaceae bacterium]|nr:hypothetical protein [Nocardioidaceae bacterium]
MSKASRDRDRAAFTEIYAEVRAEDTPSNNSTDAYPALARQKTWTDQQGVVWKARGDALPLKRLRQILADTTTRVVTHDRWSDVIAELPPDDADLLYRVIEAQVNDPDSLTCDTETLEIREFKSQDRRSLVMVDHYGDLEL